MKCCPPSANICSYQRAHWADSCKATEQINGTAWPGGWTVSTHCPQVQDEGLPKEGQGGSLPQSPATCFPRRSPGTRASDQKILRPDLSQQQKHHHQEPIRIPLTSCYHHPPGAEACRATRKAYAEFVINGVWISLKINHFLTVSFLVQSLALNNNKGERDCCSHKWARRTQNEHTPLC